MQLLPDGPARNALVELVEADVIDHVQLEENRSYNRMWRAELTISLVQAVAATVLAVVSFTAGDISDVLASPLFSVVVVVLVLLQIPDVILLRRMGHLRTRREVDEEAKGSTATARRSLQLRRRTSTRTRQGVESVPTGKTTMPSKDSVDSNS
ncbi:hypothetical protein [Nocardioides pocheonensis]|nr:hypothetical protein [Nocardioides pocheonensis]